MSQDLAIAKTEVSFSTLFEVKLSTVSDVLTRCDEPRGTESLLDYLVNKSFFQTSSVTGMQSGYS
jgi:hypothetical protein